MGRLTEWLNVNHVRKRICLPNGKVVLEKFISTKLAFKCFATYSENILHCDTPHTYIKLFYLFLFNDICDPLNWFHI